MRYAALLVGGAVPSVIYQYSMRQREQENGRLGVSQLRLQIAEWNLKYRILEKISSWGLAYSSRKIAQIPQEFMAEGFVFYILKVQPQLIRDCHSSLLLDSLLTLKKVYTAHSIQYFRQNDNFHFALVVLAKLLRYFLLSSFPHLSPPSHLEAHIFASVTYALLGYPVDLSAYALVEQKLAQRRRERLDRVSQSLDQSLHKEMRKTVDRRIRRWGLKDSLLSTKHKELEHFRLEVQETLRTRVPPAPSLKKQETEQPKTKNLNSCDNCYAALEQAQEISFRQISAAMMAHQGFNSPKNSPKMQLSRLNKANQHPSNSFPAFSLLNKENSAPFDGKMEKKGQQQGQKRLMLRQQLSQKVEQIGQKSQKQQQLSQKVEQRGQKSQKQHLSKKGGYKKCPKKESEQQASEDCVLLTLDNRLTEDRYARLRKKAGTCLVPKMKHVRSQYQFVLPRINQE